MQKFVVILIILIFYIVFVNSTLDKVETGMTHKNFKLSFKNKKLNCKCKPEIKSNLEEDSNLEEKPNIEQFTTINPVSNKQENKKPIKERVYNLSKIKELNDMTAEEYYSNKYNYPMIPGDILELDINTYNNMNYLDIGNFDDSILNKLGNYNDNDQVESFKYSIGK